MDYITCNITLKLSDWGYQFSVTVHKYYVLLGRPDPFTGGM